MLDAEAIAVPARIVALVVCALVLTACGPAEPLTHAELVERADAICSHAFAQVREIGADLPEPDAASVGRWADALDRTTPILEGMVNDLRDLEPPPADREGFDALLAAYDLELKALEEVRTAAEAGDPDGMSEPSEDATFAWIDADHVASRLGLEGCRLLGED